MRSSAVSTAVAAVCDRRTPWPSAVADRRYNGRHRRRLGFTLLEVMIALGVFAFAVLGLLAALEKTVDAAKYTQQDGAIRNGIENRLARLSVGRLRPLSDEETIGGVTFLEKVEREEIRNADNAVLPGFWRLSVTARWNDPAGKQEWTATHLVFRAGE